MCPVGMICIPALWFGVGVTAIVIFFFLAIFLLIGVT